jgi:hypothetical protein
MFGLRTVGSCSRFYGEWFIHVKILARAVASVAGAAAAGAYYVCCAPMGKQQEQIRSKPQGAGVNFRIWAWIFTFIMRCPLGSHSLIVIKATKC